MRRIREDEIVVLIRILKRVAKMFIALLEQWEKGKI